MSSHVHYSECPRLYRFVTREQFEMDTGILRSGEQEIGTDFIRLQPGGLLTIAAGFLWDGASGPIKQTPDLMRGSLVHDALYTLMRAGLLAMSWRPRADALLREMCVTDGMPRWQADMVHAAVSMRGSIYAEPETPRPVLVAPVPVVYPSAAEQVAP